MNSHLIKVKRNMNRLDTYCRLLKDIYGERIVKSFTMRNENNFTLKMNNEHDNQKTKKYYDRKDGEGCDTCKPSFRNIKTVNFFKRNFLMINFALIINRV